MKRLIFFVALLSILIASCMVFASCHVHEYGEWKVVEHACNQVGQEVRVCACGEAQARDIPMTNHVDNNYDWVCDNCGGDYSIKFLDGEYKHKDPWSASAYYGVKVNVAVRDDTILWVTITSENTDDYKNVSSSSVSSYFDRNIWLSGEQQFLLFFVGRSVDAIQSLEIDCDESGSPLTIGGFTKVTGATQSSGRVILAVQDALSKLNDSSL